MWRLVPFFFMVIAACKRKSPEQRFFDFINDPKNKITQTIRIGETTATAKYLTKDYRRMTAGKNTDSTGSNEGYYFFDLRFDKTTGEKPGKEKILYLNFDMNRDFVLLLGKDSISPAICQRIENGRPGSYEYVLAFDKSTKPEAGDFTLFYHDKMFGTGTLAFVYNKKDIEKIPVLKTTAE